MSLAVPSLQAPSRVEAAPVPRVDRAGRWEARLRHPHPERPPEGGPPHRPAHRHRPLRASRAPHRQPGTRTNPPF
eukprot:6666500-Pyramimonas_sp.AAC.1